MKDIKIFKIPKGCTSFIAAEQPGKILTLSEEDLTSYVPATALLSWGGAYLLPTWNITLDLKFMSVGKFLNLLFQEDGYYIVHFRDDFFPSKEIYKERYLFSCFGIAFSKLPILENDNFKDQYERIL